MNSHERFMQEALKEALKAYEAKEVPVGAVIVYKDKLIARAHNQMITLKDPTAHAEMIAITQAASALNNERLPGATLYVTLEPCAMCAGAMVLARVKKIVYGAKDPKAGACGSIMDVVRQKKLNHHAQIKPGVLGADSAHLLKTFFKERRGKGGPSEKYVFDLGIDN